MAFQSFRRRTYKHYNLKEQPTIPQPNTYKAEPHAWTSLGQEVFRLGIPRSMNRSSHGSYLITSPNTYKAAPHARRTHTMLPFWPKPLSVYEHPSEYVQGRAICLQQRRSQMSFQNFRRRTYKQCNCKEQPTIPQPNTHTAEPRSSLRTLDAEHTNIAISNTSDGFFTEIQRLQINRARSLHRAGNILRTNSPMLKNYTLVSTYKPED